MSLIMTFSRKALRENINKMVTEMEDGVMLDGGEQEGMETIGPDAPTGLMQAAQQACGALGELIKQGQAHGVDTSDYTDMVDQIHAAFGLPGGTAEVQ